MPAQRTGQPSERGRAVHRARRNKQPDLRAIDRERGRGYDSLSPGQQRPAVVEFSGELRSVPFDVDEEFEWEGVAVVVRWGGGWIGVEAQNPGLDAQTTGHGRRIRRDDVSDVFDKNEGVALPGDLCPYDVQVVRNLLI